MPCGKTSTIMTIKPPIRQLPMLGVSAEQRRSGKNFLEQHVGKSAEYRAVQSAHAAEDDHHEHEAGLLPGENIGIDETELAGGEIAGQPRERAGEHERAELVREHGKADGTHALFVEPDAGQGSAEGRVQHSM